MLTHDHLHRRTVKTRDLHTHTQDVMLTRASVVRTQRWHFSNGSCMGNLASHLLAGLLAGGALFQDAIHFCQELLSCRA